MVRRIDQIAVHPVSGDTRDKTLLVITPDYPDEKNQYLGSLFVKDQIGYLKPFFKEIIIICPVLFSCRIMPNDRYCTDYRYDNVSVFYPRCFFVPRLIPVLSYQWKLGVDFRPDAVLRCIKKHDLKFDLVHAQFTWPSAYAAALIRKKYNVPYVITPHEDPGWLREEIDLKDPRMERAWADADRIMYMNSLEVPKLKPYNSRTISVPNGFNPIYFPRDMQACRDTLDLPNDVKILFTFGNLQKRKGLEYLIEAMDLIKKTRDDVQCYIGGKAEYEKAYETFIRNRVTELNLEDQVHFLGFMDGPDIPTWLNACDLYVLPSLEEGFGISQIEALACGKPVIAAKNSGSMDILTDPEVGILCERADSGDFSKGILRGLEKTWDLNRILLHAQHYSWDTVSKKLIEVYSEVLQEPVVP